MSAPIALSLAGDGRLVILTPQTVRKAYFQFNKVNRGYTNKEKYSLNYPGYNSRLVTREKNQNKNTVGDFTLLDALHRKYLNKQQLSYLHPQDIRCIEKEINKRIIFDNMALVENEGQLLEGYGLCKQPGKTKEKVQYIRRYGMIFILEPIMRHHVLRMKRLNLFIQDREFDFHYVYYHGLILSAGRSGHQLLFRHPLDMSISWTSAIAQFKPRQIFRVKQIYPCSGFFLLRE
ncbi:MAG: hypothetical protein Tsb0014_27610 [Pleurocapsa sp.]